MRRGHWGGGLTEATNAHPECRGEHGGGRRRILGKNQARTRGGLGGTSCLRNPCAQSQCRGEHGGGLWNMVVEVGASWEGARPVCAVDSGEGASYSQQPLTPKLCGAAGAWVEGPAGERRLKWLEWRSGGKGAASGTGARPACVVDMGGGSCRLGALTP